MKKLAGHVLDARPVIHLDLDEWVHVAAAVLATSPAAVRHVGDLGLADSALQAPATASVMSTSTRTL